MHKKFKRVRNQIVIVLLICLPFSKLTSAQGIYTISPFAANYFDPHFGIQAESYFHANDFYFSFGLGLEDTGFDYTASFNVGFRPYLKKVLKEKEKNLYYQYQEKTFLISIDIEKRFYFLEYKGENRLGVYGGGKFGYFFGTYRGISENLLSKFLIAPGTGISWELKNARLNLGYLLLQGSDKLSPHMINLKLNLFFNKNDK